MPMPPDTQMTPPPGAPMADGSMKDEMSATPGGPPSGDQGAPPEIPPAPTPSEPIQFSDMESMVSALNDAWKYLTDGRGPAVAVPPATNKSGVGGTQNPLPADVWAATWEMGMLMGVFAQQDPSLAALAYDPNSVATRTGVKTVTKALAGIARSDKAKKMLADAIAKSGGEPMDEGAEEAEEKETPESEAAESPDQQKMEQEQGTEQHKPGYAAPGGTQPLPPKK